MCVCLRACVCVCVCVFVCVCVCVCVFFFLVHLHPVSCAPPEAEKVTVSHMADLSLHILCDVMN